ncbi:hypothetical protein J1N35_037180 [Gossypium stocksii]|uniref:Uncharacterized protein n=1 Tax=Gossypium stocksii TaxID=47602 RepID=A0A9D3ZKN2_9ROSI|nr:hypothetical protein J1N35_037180 [Gossypium stocksii]
MCWTFDPYVRAFPPLQAVCTSRWDLAIQKIYTDPTSCGCLRRMTRLESDMEGQTNTSFRQWLGTMKPWQWAQSFDEGFRYNQMTTNMLEGINIVLLKTRHLLILSVFSTTFYRLTTLILRMGQQQVNQMETRNVFFEDVKDVMVAKRRMAKSMNVEVYS